MDALTFGFPGSLTGILLVGLAMPPAEPPEVECVELVAYDFTTASPPLYSVANQPDFWRNPDWLPAGASSDPVEAGFPDLLVARDADISGGQLTYINDPEFAIAVFGDFEGVLETDAYFVTQIDLGFQQLSHVYAEVGVNFEQALFDAAAVTGRHIVRCYSDGLTRATFEIVPVDEDGPPAGDIRFDLNYVTASGSYATVTVATKPRSFADGLHTFRVEMTPSTPQVPGSTTNFTLNFDGIARVYIDDVLEYENTAIRYRPRHSFAANVNDAFTIGHAVGLGHNGFVGGYTYVAFGYCEELPPEDPEEPPEPGGELPEPIEPLESDLPLGVMRVFALLTYGTGSPYSELAVAETDLNDPDSWYGGYKAPWLLEVSPITRELSDDLRGTDVTVRVADPEGVIREIVANQALGGATIEIFLVSDTVRYALGEPHRRFAGRVHSHKALSHRQYEFTIRDILSDELAQLADAPRIPPGRLTQAVFPGMTADYENKAVPIALGEVSDEDAITPQGVVPPLIVAPAMNLNFFGGVNVPVVGAILSHGALPPNGIWKAYYNTITNPYTRIPVPESAEGTIFTWPGAEGWSYVGVPTDYVDYPSDPALTYRFTPVFFLASDPNVQAFVDGRIQVAFNVYGLTDEADGSGLYFADAPDIYEFLIRNYLYEPHWRFGEYNNTPTFLRGYTIVNHASVVRSRERLRAFLGSPANYPVGFLLGGGGEQQTLRHVLTELCHGVLMEQGFDRHGRILLDVEDVDAEATYQLSDLLDIEDGEFEVWIDRSEYRNHAEYVFGRRYLPAVAPLPAPPEGETLPPTNVGEHNDWSAIGTYTHDDAIAANQGRKTPALQLENYVVRNSDVAVNWVERMIARLVGPSPSFDGQRLFRLTTDYSGSNGTILGVELGDVIEIDHIDGLGTNGFVGQRGRVLKITDDPQRARLTLEGRLLSGGSPS